MAIIFLYHSIEEIGKQNFERQMRFLSQKCNVISLGDYIKDRKSEGIIITFDDGYKDNFTAAYPVLKKYRLKATFFIATDFIGSMWNNKEMMGWSDIKAMDGMEFGAHSCSHPNLASLPADEAKIEVLLSKHILEEKLGREIRFFSYPYGSSRDFNEETKKIVSMCGFDCALTYMFGINDEKTDLFELRRGGVSKNLLLFRIKASYPGLYSMLKWKFRK